MTDSSAPPSSRVLVEKRAAMGNPQMTDVELIQQGSETKVLMAIDGCVFDVSSFLNEHPGGKLMLTNNAGKDVSDAFKKIGHSEKAKELLASFYIADLKMTEEGQAMAAAKRQAAAAAPQPKPAAKRGLPPPI